ncbi:MAG: hypothetical protein ACE5DW_00755 [Thermodesulfobacteriota bacterium]
MATPTKNWTDIPDTAIDADSPLDTTLLTEIRDDLVHMHEWLGLNYTAAVDHNHDGLNSALPASPGSYTTDGAAADLVLFADTERSKFGDAGGTWTKVKEFRVGRGGSLKVSFDGKYVIFAGAPTTVGARIYKNSIPYGTLRSFTTAYQTFTEILGGFAPGDVVQLYYVCNGSDDEVFVRNFRLYADHDFQSNVVMD